MLWKNHHQEKSYPNSVAVIQSLKGILKTKKNIWTGDKRALNCRVLNPTEKAKIVNYKASADYFPKSFT